MTNREPLQRGNKLSSKNIVKYVFDIVSFWKYDGTYCCVKEKSLSNSFLQCILPTDFQNIQVCG